MAIIIQFGGFIMVEYYMWNLYHRVYNIHDAFAEVVGFLH